MYTLQSDMAGYTLPRNRLTIAYISVAVFCLTLQLLDISLYFGRLIFVLHAKSLVLNSFCLLFLVVFSLLLLGWHGDETKGVSNSTI